MKISVERSGAFAGKPAPTVDRIPLWERRCGDPTCSRRGQWQQLTFSVLLAMSLSACTVGPDFQKPETTQIAEWAKPSKAAASQVVAETMSERWWDVFNDPKLSALTQRALTDNLDPVSYTHLTLPTNREV